VHAHKTVQLDMASRQRWCRIVLAGGEPGQVLTWELDGDGHPSLGLVEVLARLRLLSARAGMQFFVTDVSPELSGLLDLVGLRVEMERKPEEREYPVGVEKGVEPGDASS
jgi:hypothetical protein